MDALSSCKCPLVSIFNLIFLSVYCEPIPQWAPEIPELKIEKSAVPVLFDLFYPHAPLRMKLYYILFESSRLGTAAILP